MGKKQHQKDKMYLTATEWSTFYGGKKAADGGGNSAFKKLPFYCCSLSLQPFENPLATPEGVVFDLMHITPYINKHGVSPVTGKVLIDFIAENIGGAKWLVTCVTMMLPIDIKDLIKIQYYKNSDGKYHCPVTFKVFNSNSHIVAIRTTGNVYSYEAIDRLNLKTCNMKDLLRDVKFSREDILTLQDPAHPEKWDISTFHYVQHEESKQDHKAGVSSVIRQMNPETKATLEVLAEEFPNKEEEVSNESTTKDKEKSSKPKKQAHYSTGHVSTSFTSTVLIPQTTNEAAIMDHDTLLYQMVNKKGYVRLQTSFGDLNLELHCDLVPISCHNFIQLCKQGYYDNTILHRSIKNFMIQGGDPSGTGKGGQSVWKKPFKDEFKPNLTHSGRGVLSMANSGPNTNKSQFFITYRSCRHLDGKHTVFGRLVGGLEVLTEMEGITTDRNDKPNEDIMIISSTVFVDPYEEAELKATTVLQRKLKRSSTPWKLASKELVNTYRSLELSAKENTKKKLLAAKNPDFIA